MTLAVQVDRKSGPVRVRERLLDHLVVLGADIDERRVNVPSFLERLDDGVESLARGAADPDVGGDDLACPHGLVEGVLQALGDSGLAFA